MKKYTVEEIRKYIESQDSLGDVLYNLREEMIDQANQSEMLEIVGAEALCDFKREVEEDDLERVAHEIYEESEQEYKDPYYDHDKFLWVVYPDGTEKQLVDVIPYPK